MSFMEGFFESDTLKIKILLNITFKGVDIFHIHDVNLNFCFCFSHNTESTDWCHPLEKAGIIIIILFYYL